MRLIDADRLIEDMGASCLPIMEKGISEITGDESSIVDHINSAPAIDAVPVVRCKDCKHMRERHYEKPGEEPYIKRACESKYGLTERYMVNEWDYCSRGERRI